VEPGEEIDRLVAQRAYDQVEGWMREMGMSEDAAHDLVARAVNRIDAEDATGGPHDPLEGRAVAGWLTPRSMRSWKRRSWSSSASRGCHPS